MSTLLVKKNSQWNYPSEVYVKDNNRWKSAKEVWVKEGNEWKIVWPNNTGTITYSEPKIGVFQVPDGIYSIEVYWPTSSTYISSATLAVTPGSQVSYQIGDYGETSNFGGIATGKFDKEVIKFRGNVDDTLYQSFSVAVASTGSYSNYNDDTGLGAGTLSANAAAVGINYTESNETRHGDLPANISLTPAVISDLLPGDFKIAFSEVNVVVQGGTSIISQQPTVSNSYIGIIFTNDPSGAPPESVHYYTANLRQRTPISIKWGDWINTATIHMNPSAPEVYLVSPNTGTTAGGKSITISGKRFISNTATGVTIGGSLIGSFNVVSDTSITGTTPAGSLGNVDVVVTGWSGSNGNGNGLFTYVNPVAAVLTYNVVYSAVIEGGTLTFNVSSGPPNGTVYITDTTYNVPSDTFVLNSSGVGTFTTPIFGAAGTHDIVATFSDGHVNAPYALTVN